MEILSIVWGEVGMSSHGRKIRGGDGVHIIFVLNYRQFPMAGMQA